MRKLTLIIASLLCYVGVLHAEVLVTDGVYTIEGGAKNQHRGYLAAGDGYAGYPVLSDIEWGSYAGNSTKAIENGKYWYVQCADGNNTYYIYNIALGKFLDGNNNQVSFGDAPYAWEIVSNLQGGINYTSIKYVSFACGSKPRNVNYHWEPGDGGSMHTIKAVDNATDYAEQVATAKFKIMLSTATAIENVSDISNEQAYVFYTVRSPLYSNSDNKVGSYWTSSSMAQQGSQLDVTKPEQQFALLRTENTEDGKYYLYSVASGKFIINDNQASDTPEADVTLNPVTHANASCFEMSFAEAKVNVTWWSNSADGIRLNSAASTDEGNAFRVYIAEGNYDLSAALAAIQDVETPDVAKIGEQGYATLTEALAATKDMTGDVTVEIYNKVTFNQPLTGNYTSINFVGKDTDAEMYLDVQGYTTATGKKVTFTDLKLSKSEGGFIANAGFMNVAFGIYDVEEVTYTNCTFENGACASSGKVTFDGCTFKKSWDKYGLWAYGNVDVTVQNSTFADYRGIKMYAENGAAAGVEKANLTVKNTNFSAVDNKPAIVLTYGESVVLEGNTYSSTGTFELDLDGKPNGVAVTSDVAPVCVNDNGACGVLVDGKIYTTVAQAAEVATETSTVTLLHSSNETVEFPMGTTIEKNGFTADNVTTAQPFAEYVVLPTSMTVNNYKALFGTNTVTDGTNYYATLQAAVEAVAKNAGVTRQVNAILYCKPGADVGSLQHAPVVSTLTINGNGANVTGGSERDFDLGNTDPSGGKDITADMTLTVKHLNGCGAWGAKATEHTVNLVFENCANMGKVFITGTTGTLNITMNDCAFEGVLKEAVYSNADGAITLNNVAFSNLNKAINLNHKAAGTQTVTINGCSFTNCGADVAADQIPVRVLSSVEGGKSVLNVSNATFTGTPEGGADILLDYAVGLTEATVAGTTANVVVEKENNVGTKTEVSTDNNYEFTTAKPVANIGNVEYATLEEAAAAAQAGDVITLNTDATLSAELTLPAGVTLNGNGKQINGDIIAGGEITFAGVTKATSFNVKNANTVINIPAGASLQLTGTGRMVIGHGCTFNITGTIADAKTANVADVTPSLVMPGASFTGAGVTFNVTNAYIKTTASYCSSSKSASGTFDFNINNSIWEQFNKLAFESQSTAATVNFDLVESVLNTGSHLVFGVSRGAVVIDNSNVNVGKSNQIENRSTMTIKNGSVVNGAVATSSNAINPGTIIVENATYAVTGEFSGAAEGTGTLIIKKGANVSVGSIKAGANVTVDAEGMTAGEEINFTANLSQFTGTLSVINNDKLEASIVDGKVVLAAKPVAKIGEQGYATLNEAFAAATEGQTITMLDDATPALTSQRAITKAAVIDLGGKTMTLTEDDLYFGTTTFKNGTIVVDPSVKASTAVFWMFANQTLTFDNVKIVATGVTGTYLIGLDGNNSDLNLLNGSEILVENTTALDLDIICVNASTGNDIKVENSKVNVTNLDGRVFFRGNYTVAGNSEINLEGITKAGFRIEAGQTLSIKDNAKVTIVGEPRDGGIHLTDLTATYTKDETATVNATLNEVTPAAVIGTQKFATLQAAIDAVQNGETIILQKDCAEVVSVNKSNVAFTIDGQNKAYTGKIQIAIGQNVTVKNVAFAHTGDESHDFIANVGSPTGKNYNTTLLVEACSFTGNGKGTDVAVRTIHPTAVTIKGCTASGLHSFLQNTGGQTVAIENVTLTESKGGLAIGSPNGAVSVKGCNLTTSTYGVRLDANNTNAPGATLENNTVKAYIPVSVRKATVENYVVTVEGDKNNYTATNSDGVWFAACTTEYEDGVALNEPTGKVKVTLTDTGLDAAGIYGSYYDALTIYVGATQNSRMVTRDIYVATMDEAVAEAKAINAGAVTYKVYGEVELTTGGSHGILDLGKNVVIEGADAAAKLTIVGGGVPDIKGVTFKNIILADEGTYLPTANEFMYQNYIDCTFENVTFVDGIRLSGTSSIKDSKVEANTTNEYAIWLDEGVFTMTGTTVVGGADAYGLVKSDEVSKITITGNTFQYLGEANKEALNTKGAVIIAENNQFIDCVKGILPADKTNYTDESKTTVATDAAIAGNNTVTVYYAAVGEQKFETLLEAINAVQEGETITLLRDVTMDYNARDAYETQAQNVVINGNGKTLTLNQTNSDWSSFGLANGSKLVLNDMTINKSGKGATSGAWNTHAIIFSCPVEMSDVTVNNSVAVQAGATLNNVAINEANGYYGLWINGNGQEVTVNGGSITATNGGRGIKIADQYIDNPAQVTLNVDGTVFNTAKKSAVLVSSKAGAKIAAANVNITNVAEDNVNFVWVDEDWAQHFGNVEVTGATVRAESAAAFTAAITANGAVQAYYKTLAEAINAAQAGATVELLADVEASEVILVGKSLTINGNDHKVTSSATRVFRVTTSDTEVTLNNVNMVSSAKVVYPNDVRGISIDAQLQNVKLTLNGCSVDFTDATACDWAYAVNVSGNGTGHTVTVNGGTYEGANVINAHGANNTVTVKDATLNCTYPNNDMYAGACIWVLQNQGSSVEATGNTFNGNNAVAFNLGTGTTLTASNNTDNTVKVVAKIGAEYYTSLAEAFAAAEDGATIKVLQNAEVAEAIVVNKKVVIDLNGKKVTSTAKKAFEVYADATIQNGTIEAAQRCVDTRKAVELTLTDVTLIADKYTTHGNPQPLTIGGSENGTKVTMTNVNISAAAGYGIITFVKTELTATESTIGGYNALYVKPGSDNSVFNFVKSTLSGSTADNDVEGNSFSVVAVRANNVTVDVDAASTVAAAGSYSYAISFKSSYQNEAATGSSVTVAGTITGNILTALNGNTVRVNAEYADELQAAGYATSVADGLATAKAAVAKIGNTNYATLDEAIAAAKAGDTVIVFEGTYAVPAMKAGITVEGEGEVLLEGTLSGTLENLTLKNLHIKGGNAQRWAYAKGNLVFENVTFEATSVYALHFDGITEGTNLTYKNCTIIGWAALGGSPASCKFEGCTFKGNGTYGLIRTYFDTTIDNCTFDVANVNTTDNYQDGIHAVEGANVTVTSSTNANGDMKAIVNVHGSSVVTVDGTEYKNVAKIGETKYITIDDAIAAWTHNTTLTLLADVTLTDVIKLSSTEMHTLDLGIFTMTAASKKDAIQIVNNGRSSASYTLDIKADATNPGGITATGKSVVVTTGKSGVKDRPIIRFYNGVFNGSYIVKHSGSNGTNCPQFQFHGGVFNGTINTNRAMMLFYGGTFNGSLWMSVDSSAYGLVAGGRFKQLSNSFGSSLNSSKFTIGSAKGVYDREVYVDNEGYYVVAAAEPEGIEADVAKTPGTNDYFAYSKVGTEGQMAYTDVETALKNNTSATVTVYADEIDMTDITFKGTIIIPAGEKVTITNAPEGLKVATAERYFVYIKDGVYESKIAVAKIGEQNYASLAEALTAAKDGETVNLLWKEGQAPLAMNGSVFGKSVTIKGTAKVDWSKGFLFVGRGGEGDATVTFDEANLTSASNSASYGIHVSGREKDTNNKYNGTLVINNSTIELDYLINKGAMTLDKATLTVKNGFAIGGRPASETESGADATATISLTNGSKVVVNNHNGMGLGYEAIGVMNIDATSTFETTQSFLVTAKGTMNVAGTAKVEGTLTNNGAIVLTAAAATLTSTECNNVTTNVADHKVVYADGAYKVVAKNYVAKVGDAQYETLSAALAAAEAGATITLVADVTEDVTTAKAVNIDGAGKTYTGAMTLKADATIKNVNFDGKGYNGYAITTRGANYLTIEGCTAKNYGYGFVQLASGTALTTVKDVTVSNVNYGVKVDYSNAVVLDNVDITAGVAALLNSNYGEKTITIKNSKLNILGTWKRNDTVKTTYVFEGENIVDDFTKTVPALDIFKNAAQVVGTTAIYGDLNAAFAAVESNGTVKLLGDFTTEASATVPAGKVVTLDLNGKTISQEKACTASYEMICNKGNLTITGEGKISFKDTGAGDPNFGWGSYTVRNEGNLVVENGTIEHLGAQTFGTHCIMAIYQYCGSTTINGGTISTPNYRSARLWKGEMTINGGTFDGQVWVQAVDNTAKLTVNGGTFEPNGGDASAVFVTNSTYDVDFAVTGGTFNGKVGCSDATKLAGAITGGKFNETAKNGTNAALLATGLTFGEADADGYYTIADDPATHYINNVEEFLAFRDAVNGGNDFAGVAVYLTADIDLTGIDWSVNIGDDAGATFDGTFDGQGHTIKNLTSTETAQKGDGYICTGLFGAIHGGAVLKDFTIENVTINTGDFTGNNVAAVVGFAWKATGSIENVHVTGNININAKNVTGVGAILGYDYYSPALTVKNCSVIGNDGSAILGKSYVGGLVGYASSKIAMNSNTIENVSVTATASVGAIAGIMLSGSSAADNTVKNVALTATGELWANSAAVVAGTITSGGVTVANTTVENVTANGAAAALVGGQLVEKPTAPIAKVEAKIGDKYYTTLENAYVAAQAGATIELLAPVVIASGETLTLDKDVTITYTSNVAGEDMFTNRGTLNISAGTITYVNTDKTGSNVTVSTISNEPGSVLNITGGTVENKTVKADGSSIYSYAIDMLTNGSLGDVTATISGGTVSSDYMAIRQFNNGTACKNSLTINGGYIYGAKRAVQVHLNNNAAYTTISGGKVEAGADGYAICNFAATGNLEVTGGEFIGAVYSARENFISGGTYNNPVEAAYCAEGYMPNKNANGTYGVVAAQDAVAAVGGFAYATLAEAVKAAKAGEVITLLQDVKENVTINKNLTIDGAGKTITGMITTDGKSLKVTIKNVNFDGDNKQQYYAVKADNMYSLTIQDCTAKNYAYGFLYANRNNYNVTVKNVTVENCANYGAYASSVSGSATFENFTVKGARYGVLVANKGTRNVNFKNVTFEGAETPLYINENGTGKVTFTFEGINEMSKAEYYTSQYVNVVAAAQAGTKVCGSLNEAFTAAATGDIVTLLSDISLTAEDAVKTTDGKNRDVLAVVNGKEITLDMNGKKISVNHQSTTNAERLWAVIYVEDGAGLTVTGNGSIDVDANDNTPKVVYMFLKNGSTGYLVIENGNFHMDNSEDSMVFSGSSNTITVKGGTFILDAVASKTNGWPVFFGVNGTNTGYVNVLGGTYNYDITQQANGEVKIGSGFTIRDNGDDTWSVVTGVSIIDGQLTEYANDKTQMVEYISYKRKIAAGIWNPLYVPFEIPVEVLQELGYEVAIFYDVHFEITDGGVIDPTSTPDLHIVKIKEGTLKANYPYLIRATKDADLNLSLELENETLYSTAAKESVEAGSTTTRFIFAGTYTKATPEGLTGRADVPCYVLTSRGTFGKMATDARLSPFRVFMYVLAKDGSPVILNDVAAEAIRIRVIGESDSDTTEIKYYESDEVKAVDYIFDLQGRRVLEPQKGNLYIINGKKVIF